MSRGKWSQGIFRPINPAKYKGDVTNIVYRSSWELKLLSWLDTNKNVLRYSSEEVVIWYRSPVDGKKHRYFVDFWVRFQKGDKVEEWLIEVKPSKQTMPPVQKTKHLTESYVRQVKTYAVNHAKWEAAKALCEQRGWHFKIFTEKELGISTAVDKNRKKG